MSENTKSLSLIVFFYFLFLIFSFDIFVVMEALVVDHLSILIPLAHRFLQLNVRQLFQEQQRKSKQRILQTKFVVVTLHKCGELLREVMVIRCQSLH